MFETRKHNGKMIRFKTPCCNAYYVYRCNGGYTTECECGLGCGQWAETEEEAINNFESMIKRVNKEK